VTILCKSRVSAAGSLDQMMSMRQSAVGRLGGSSVRSLERENPAGEIFDQLSDTCRVELSVVMPCLNERETVGVCVRKAIAALKGAAIAGEVIVADSAGTIQSLGSAVSK
jgi:hypothetical protein